MKNNQRFFDWEHLSFVLLLILGGIGLFWGWKVFWFLTDDAFIAFRYVSNSLLGHGYVWNPAPFLPVEGYTSFLWIFILETVWKITGIAPPESANVLSFIFTYLTLTLYSYAVMRILASGHIRKWRILSVAFFLGYLLFNRTFLTWASSGLETALFNFLLCAWIFVLLFQSNPKLIVGLGSFITAILTLTRPDGLLFCAAMIAVLFIEIMRVPDRREKIILLLYGTLPFGIVINHLIWRLSFYGEWLPNTYYAKVAGAWPKSGIIYAFSFILEYGLWFAIAIICMAVLKLLRLSVSGKNRTAKPKDPLMRFKEILLSHGTRFSGIAALLAHVSYYTFIVGGDHFEYRVYSHLIPLIFLAFLWALHRLETRAFLFFGLTLGFILLSMPVQWTHWALTKDLNTRKETYVMVVPIAEKWPIPFRFYAGLFDKTQAWLIPHHVCMRHQEHKIFWQDLIGKMPSREDGGRVSSEGFPVGIAGCVGIAAWTLPHVNIIDLFGLNDYVIARTPIKENNFLMMAHNRQPPDGYVASYRLNVSLENRRVKIRKRWPPLTEDNIRKTEVFWRKKIRRKGFGGSE